jgi:hypothetical protein
VDSALRDVEEITLDRVDTGFSIEEPDYTLRNVEELREDRWKCGSAPPGVSVMFHSNRPY